MKKVVGIPVQGLHAPSKKSEWLTHVGLTDGAHAAADARARLIGQFVDTFCTSLHFAAAMTVSALTFETLNHTEV